MDNNWALFLVNSDNILPNDFKVKTRTIQGKYIMDRRAAPYAVKMIKKARNDGIILNVESAYRTIKYQKKLFDEDVNEKISMGMNYNESISETRKSLALPGESEHNAGLALDILSDEFPELSQEFENSKAFKWLADNAYKYGFILRYPRGKENITKIIFEPWHYRFVGVFHAKKIKDSFLCLEEYIMSLKNN